MTLSKELSILLRVTAGTLLLMGLLARVAPLVDHEDRLLKQWPTEDGYLMLTIARNMSLGFGMSTSNGELPTNGTQPLATGIWAVGFAIAGGDKPAGVFFALLMQVGFSVVAALLLYRVATEIFRRGGIAREWALVVAGLWFSSTLVVPHSMNCLESGLYVMLVLAAANLYLRGGLPGEDGSIQFTWRMMLLMAFVLGACFWARNDAVWLIAAFCLSCLFSPGSRSFIGFGNLPKVLVAGSLTVLLALPWLVNNVMSFGHLMPISGIAQSAAAPMAVNAPLIPIKLLEYLAVVLPVPHSIERNPVVLAISFVLVLLAVGFGAAMARRLPADLRHFAVFVTLFGMMILGYYGVVHGAPHFMARYLFPLSPFLAILSVAALAIVAGRLRTRISSLVIGIAITAALVINIGLNLRIYQNGSHHMHEQVVDWVARNVHDSDWIGAVQTGTLGFFHDRTVNLDGKVNPEALEAVIAGTIPSYVNEKQLVVLADWRGIADWVQLPGIAGNFQVLVADDKRNLGVLGRIDWVGTSKQDALSPFRRQ